VRNIRKSAEPEALAQYCRNPDAYYGGLTKESGRKETIHAALISEQRGLCCYCMSRITMANSTIEHWSPQNPSDKTTPPTGGWRGPLDYTNLLAVCPGNEGKKPKEQHCDERKGEQVLKFNPAVHDVEAILKYGSDGTISSTDAEFDGELDRVLNLNYSLLKDNRKKVLKGFTDGLHKTFRDKPAPRGYLENCLKDWNGDSPSGDLKPFCQVVVYWIKKKLRAVT
jgi:hypothetical protein